MKTYPNSYKERNEINLRHGIKSSLGEIKELFALVYTLYLSDNKNSSIAYSKEVNAPSTQIEIQDALLANAKNLFGALVVDGTNFKNAINNNHNCIDESGKTELKDFRSTDEIAYLESLPTHEELDKMEYQAKLIENLIELGVL